MKDNSQIKVTSLYNYIPELPYKDETANITIDGAKDDAIYVADALKECGYQTDIFELNPETQSQLTSVKTDIFFNLCDGIGDIPGTEPDVPKVLDELGLKYTGAGEKGMIVTTSKAKTKEVFEQMGAKTPKYWVMSETPDKEPTDILYPLLIKPEGQDCSIGITQDSVVENFEQLKREVKKITESYSGAALVEQYIDGREINLTLVDNGDRLRMLPISEIIFGESFDNSKDKKIVDFDAKWSEDTANYQNTYGVCPADLPEELVKHIEKLALKIYPEVGAQDYARIDIRLDKDLTPYFLEVNVNPDLSPGMGASRSAQAVGWEYPEFLSQIVRFALARYEK